MKRAEDSKDDDDKKNTLSKILKGIREDIASMKQCNIIFIRASKKKMIYWVIEF